MPQWRVNLTRVHGHCIKFLSLQSLFFPNDQFLGARHARNNKNNIWLSKPSANRLGQQIATLMRLSTSPFAGSLFLEASRLSRAPAPTAVVAGRHRLASGPCTGKYANILSSLRTDDNGCRPFRAPQTAAWGRTHSTGYGQIRWHHSIAGTFLLSLAGIFFFAFSASPKSIYFHLGNNNPVEVT